MNRDATLTVRFTEEELPTIRGFVFAYGYRSMSEFVREAVAARMTGQTIMDPELHYRLTQKITAAADACKKAVQAMRLENGCAGEETAQILIDAAKRLSTLAAELEFFLKSLASSAPLNPPGR